MTHTFSEPPLKIYEARFTTPDTQTEGQNVFRYCRIKATSYKSATKQFFSMYTNPQTNLYDCKEIHK